MAVDVQDSGTAPKVRLWYDPRFRALFFQALVILGVVGFFVFIGYNTAVNLEKRGIASGFGFLSDPAGFEIPLTLWTYSVDDGSTHGDVFMVGLLNTVLVSSMGIVLATVIGFVLGVLRLSKNWLIGRLVGVYIECVRNVPLLLQFLFWHFAVFLSLPQARESLSVGEAFFLNNRGINTPMPMAEPGIGVVYAAFVVAVLGIWFLARWAKKRQDATGQQFPVFLTGLGAIIGLPLLAAIASGFPLSFDYPELGRFRIVGGLAVPVELFSALMALTIYTSAFIAEIVRAGILAISHGQTEASYALGLRPNPTMRMIIIPQALRVIVPPLISQYLNLTKNSSLGIAIGYPDIVNVFMGISGNQTGQAVETVAMTMAVYLSISLIISFFMNIYNKRIALVER